ncbi:MAG: DMT family transporter [Patescibacteria group bacterium]
MTDRQKAFLSIFLYSLLSGAMAAVTKVGLSQVPPLSFAFIRFLLATVIVAPFIWKEKKSFIKDLKTLGPFSMLATLNIIFFILGIKLTTANISQILYAAVPIIAGVLTYFVLGEKQTLRKISGIILGFIGVFPVLILPILEKGKFSGDLLGNFLLVLAVISWSLYMMLSKKAQETHSPYRIVSIFIIITTVVLFPFFLFESIVQYGWWTKINAPSILSIFYVVLAGTIATYLLNQYSIKHGGVVFASMAYYLSPIFGFIVAFVLLGETLPSLLIVGGVLTLLGVFLATGR